MQIIDAHAHYLNLPNYLENLIEMMDQCHIDMCCLSGLGKIFNCKDNEDVKDAMKKYPNRIIGSYYIRLGQSKIEELEDAYSHGFRMLKTSIPFKPYDHPNFFPMWQKAADYQFPVLFHTGIVTMFQKPQDKYISSWFMHPMRLEPIANKFNKLNLIIAHLGVHWNKDAAELIRMRPNVYADITGEPDGWRIRADKIGLDKWLWWDKAYEKLVFGTDVHYTKIPIILKQDKERINQLQFTNSEKSLFYSKNILKLLGDM
ncbi:MAG: amidohydrolase family protein [Candidatus Lokiarchaeota archaeon]|nr:amidohydrolase family protein [Candidatus Lokiarchaeota archaeon]MBD3199964.1 amidohydrolase family protein [Candidatus Lokiarchaeota archaeon]